MIVRIILCKMTMSGKLKYVDISILTDNIALEYLILKSYNIKCTTG